MSYTIYVTSQSYGYGPTSSLFTILRTLQNKLGESISINVIGTNEIKTFSAVNSDVNTTFVDKLDPEKANLVLSAYDPFLIIEAWSHNINTIFYCNLLWFWKVSQEEKKIQQYRDQLVELKHNSPEKVMPRFLEIVKENFNIGMYLGYLLANQCFVRLSSLTESTMLPLKKELNITYLSPLMPKFEFNNLQRKKQIFFQLSGSQNPTTSREKNSIHVHFCWQFICDLALNFSDYSFILCLNPNLYELISDPSSRSKNIEIITTISQRDNQRYMYESEAIFISPGLCTLYEATEAKCPVFLLPEQNIGQHPNYLMLTKAGYKAKRILIGEMYLGGEHLDEENNGKIFKEIAYLTASKNLHENGDYATILKTASEFIIEMRDPSKRQAYVENNFHAVHKFTGNLPFSAGEEIAEYISNQIVSFTHSSSCSLSSRFF